MAMRTFNRPFSAAGAKASAAPCRTVLRAAAPSAGASRCLSVRVESAASSSSGGSPKVLLTREEGKNDKLRAALTSKGYTCLELPLIRHEDGPDRALLPALLRAAADQYEWVTITSPEAATVFLEGWAAAGKPKVRVAAVGGGTGEALKAGGVTPEYVPTKALGKVMGAELPKVPGGSRRVLYPASVKASTDLQDSLTEAGFEVHRINTYNTTSVREVPAAQLQEALAADVVTYGSPSAVKAWVGLAGLAHANSKVNACIGSTSAKACANAGITQHVVFPDAPGIEGWVEAVERGCRDAQLPLPQPAAV
ncbi:hypothetical protein HYH02_014844 [Chlamydomonas schloesseri]|uniref:Uroporphyrinogen-III synthase n=1 Tax=Chlamydomonas schloesseri TaxID=2026947 RepID=A0A835SFQ1_9CHLO|nr:hypothetical protein HYH02_014844 [Chlamydomonas schloesseri]|eukprot:KAG2426129.1 hypothetical protein HYH02_014844 [Chlamydomonas schloesseri]